MITLYAFNWVPDFAKGQVRDLRVRWALEEAGMPYKQVLIGQDHKLSADYLALQPFGQVPAIEYDGRHLFESGAIVLHIARNTETLMPTDLEGQARAEAWVFAALNSVEPYFANLADIDFFSDDEEAAKKRRPAVVQTLETRLDRLEGWLGERDFLENSFSAGDLMMASVLRIADYCDIIDQRPRLKAYRDRCTARPAFQKALADQLRSFTGAAPRAA